MEKIASFTVDNESKLNEIQVMLPDLPTLLLSKEVK